MEEFLAWVLKAGMALIGLPVVLAAVAAIVWFLIASSNRRTLGIIYILIVYSIEIFTHIPKPYLDLGGLQAYAADILVVVLLAIIVLEWFRRPLPLQVPMMIWLIFGGLLLYSVATGLSQYGKSGGTEARDYTYYWVVGFYCCTCNFTEEEIRKIGSWCTWTGYLLIGIAFYRWIGLYVGFVPLELVMDVGITSVFRVLPSQGAIFLAGLALLQGLAWLRGTGSRWCGVHAMVFIIAILVLQHRSVWLAFAVGALYLAFQERRYLPGKFPWLLGFLVFAGIATGIAAAFGYLDPLFDALDASFSSVTASRSTVTDRMGGWESLVDDWRNSDWKTHLLGFPYGHGWHRVIEGRVAEYGPHNFYVETTLRMGVLGLLFMVLATATGAVLGLASKVDSETEYLATRGCGVMLLASLVYYVPYSASYVQGAVTGIALSMIMQRSSRRRQQRLAADKARRANSQYRFR